MHWSAPGFSLAKSVAWTQTAAPCSRVCPCRSMKFWRHERSISPMFNGTTLTDKLTFEPRFARGATAWFIRKVFEHRHRVLRKRLR